MEGRGREFACLVFQYCPKSVPTTHQPILGWEALGFLPPISLAAIHGGVFRAGELEYLQLQNFLHKRKLNHSRTELFKSQ